MSISSLASSGASHSRLRAIVNGIPTSSGAVINLLQRHRRQKTIPIVAILGVLMLQLTRLLANDNHLFKWIDEGILEEIESINVQSDSSLRLLIQDINLTKSACEDRFAEIRKAVNKELKIALFILFICCVTMYFFLLFVE